jgi:hypothetical protein
MLALALVFGRVHKIAKSDRWICHVCLSLCPSVRLEQLGSQNAVFREFEI